MKRVCIGLLAVAVLSILPVPAPAVEQFIAPADAKTVREIGSSYLVLNGLAVKNTGGLEDRTILEFPMAEMPPDPLAVYLDLWINNFDEPPPPGPLDVFTFFGDGQVQTQDFFAGLYRSTLVDPGSNASGFFVTLDVTDFIGGAITQGYPYASFRLSTLSTDRWVLGTIGSLPNPQLRIVPEPGSASILLLTSCLALAARRRQARFAAGRQP